MGAYLEVYDPFLLAIVRQNWRWRSTFSIGQAGRTKSVLRLLTLLDRSSPAARSMTLDIPVEKLNPGAYRLDLRAVDFAGHASSVSSAEFNLQ